MKKKEDDVVDSSRAVMQEINKKLGGNTENPVIGFASEIISSARTFYTGILGVDIVAGWPSNKMSEIIGNESTGKSFIVIKSFAQAQKTCRFCLEPLDVCMLRKTCGKATPLRPALINFEGYDLEWAELNGVDNSKLIIVNPYSAEEAADTCRELINKDIADFIAWDSIAQASSDKELNSSFEDEQQMGGCTAKTLNKLSRTINTDLLRFKEPKFLVFVNQVRQVIGSFRPTFDTPGGRWQKFAPHLILSMKAAVYPLKHKDFVNISFEAKKNKAGRPKTSSGFRLWLNSDDTHTVGQIEETKSYFDYIYSLDLIKKEDKEYKVFGCDEKFQEKEQAEKYIMENPVLYWDLRKEIVKEANKYLNVQKRKKNSVDDKSTELESEDREFLGGTEESEE